MTAMSFTSGGPVVGATPVSPGGVIGGSMSGPLVYHDMPETQALWVGGPHHGTVKDFPVLKDHVMLAKPRPLYVAELLDPLGVEPRSIECEVYQRRPLAWVAPCGANHAWRGNAYMGPHANDRDLFDALCKAEAFGWEGVHDPAPYNDPASYAATEKWLLDFADELGLVDHSVARYEREIEQRVRHNQFPIPTIKPPTQQEIAGWHQEFTGWHKASEGWQLMPKDPASAEDDVTD